MRTHQKIDERSLSIHQLIAARIREDPALFDEARVILARWREIVSANAQLCLEEWESLMNQGIDACLTTATEDSEHATILRQSSPLACVLPNQERLEFFKNWKWG